MVFLNKKAEISKYNLVNESNQVAPNYDLSHKKVYFQLWMSPEKELCIIGRVDPNYICWLSLTHLKDEKMNQQIFDYIANQPFDKVSHEYLAVGNEKLNEIHNWYSCMITRSIREEMKWKTPFDSYFSHENVEEHGQFFASNVQWFYRKLVEKSRFRMEGDFYRNTLRHYHYLLSNEEDYNRAEQLIHIVEEEAYLRLSPDKTVRELYLSCCNEGRSLYNRYMARAR